MEPIWAVNKLSSMLKRDGHERLGELVYELMSYTSRGSTPQFEAELQEAFDLAAPLRNPRIDALLVHYRFQSLIGADQNYPALARLALENLERAAADELREWPVSICIARDLAVAYSDWDGPATADQCLAVLNEYADAVELSSVCYHCYTWSLTESLNAAERWGETVAMLDQRQEALLAKGRYCDTQSFLEHKIESLLGLGDADAAELCLLQLKAPEEVRKRLMHDRYRCELALLRSDGAAALHLLPPPEELLPPRHNVVEWAKLMVGTVRAGQPVEVTAYWEVLTTGLRRKQTAGAYRSAVDLAFSMFELALHGGRASEARSMLDAIRGDIPQLFAPLDAPHRLAQCEARLAGFLAASACPDA